MGDQCESDSVPTSHREGPRREGRRDCPPARKKAAHPASTFPIERVREQVEQFFIGKKGLCRQPLVRAVPALACEGGDNRNQGPSRKVRCHPHWPTHRQPPSPSSGATGRCPIPPPAKLSGAKELKEGKAQEHSWAKAAPPELPRGQSLPSAGDLALNTNIVYT